MFAGVRSKAALSKHTMMSPPPQPRGKHTPLQHVTATDAQIVVASGVLNHLEKGDHVMVDKVVFFKLLFFTN